MYPSSFSSEQTQVDHANFVSRVYAWMSLALFLTAVTAFFVASSPALLSVIFGNKLVFYGLIFGQLGLVFYLSSALMRLSANTAIALFLGYSVLNGLTLAFIFIIYTAGSIASTFLITAGLFGIMSAYGFYTKKDLTTIGNLCFMGLIGIILASIVNIFWQNSTFYWITTCIGVLVFVGQIA